MKIFTSIFTILTLSSLAFTQGPPPSPVAVTKVKEVNLEDRILVSGRVVGRHISSISPQTSGLINKIHFEVADTVKKGDVLIELDHDLIKLNIEEIKATLDLNKINSQKTKELLELQNKELDDLNQALSELPGSVSQKELRAEKSKLIHLQKQLKESNQQITINQHKLEQLKLQLSYHIIKAPFSGVILNREAAVGQWINTGAVCFALLDNQALEVELDIPSHLYLSIQKNIHDIFVNISGQELSIELKNMKIRPQVDPQSKTFIWTGKPKDSSKLLVGMAVEAHIPVSVKKNYMMVSYNAILKNDAGSYVYKVAQGPAGQMAMPVPVKLGFKKDDLVVVMSPALQAGDLLVSEGGERLFPMTPVVPKEAK